MPEPVVASPKPATLGPIPRAWVTLLCVFGVAFWLVLFRKGILLPDRVEDFTGFLVGAELLGTPKLYDVNANLATQRALADNVSSAVMYVRLPFVAAFSKPFTYLNYVSAIVAWKSLMILSLVGAVFALPEVPRRYRSLALCTSFPAAMGVWLANDAPLLLLALALALRFWKQGREVLAGMALGVLLCKFHFLAFLGLLLFQSRYRRVLFGFGLVCAALLAISFVIQPDWMKLYVGVVRMPHDNLTGRPAMMPDLEAAFSWTGHSFWFVLAGAGLLLWQMWPICRGLPFELAMPASIVAGIFVAPHANSLDGMLMIPAFLFIALRVKRLRTAAIVMLSPLAAFFYCVGPDTWGPLFFVCGTMLILSSLATSARCQSSALV